MKISTSKYRIFKPVAIYSKKFLNLTGDERSAFVTMVNAANDDGVIDHLYKFIMKTNISVSLLKSLEEHNMITLLTQNSYMINDFEDFVHLEFNPDREEWDALEDVIPIAQDASYQLAAYCC